MAPEERLSVMQALELFTRNPAYIGFEEKEKGSLEAGKFADFIVIDRDVLTIPLRTAERRSGAADMGWRGNDL